MIPSAEELKGKKYCKFHNVTNHSTNECRIFCFHVQKAIEQGRIKFELAKKLTMDIDKHPFPGVHMVEFQLAKGKTKVLMSAKAKEDGSVDPKAQISTEEYEEARKQHNQQKSRYEQGETSRASALHPWVTFRILLNKWQCQKEDYQHRLKEEEYERRCEEERYEREQA
jgi:hypothetical protein